MLDQSFSPENFRKILDYENRKGLFIEGKYFQDLYQLTHDIKACNSTLRIAKKKISAADFDTLKEQVNAKKETLKKRKEELLLEKLVTISKNITDSKYRLSITRNTTISTKAVYLVEDKPEDFFCLKQIQYNFRRLYKVKQSSRYSIVSQVKSLLDDSMPKYVIRTDISDFYETINHSILLQKLSEENLLSFYSKKIINQVLLQYRNLSGTTVGVPRGIGISAYLAELYMRDIDKEIKKLNGVIYYERYVDDIIVIFTPIIGDNPQNYLSKIDSILASKNLVRNIAKTLEFDLTQTSKPCRFDYLGYNISFGNGGIKLKITGNKLQAYKNKVDLAIDTYNTSSKFDEKLSRKLLIKRIRYLTGNTRLLNNKKNILVGIYYSNNLVTEPSDFQGLDAYLKYRINQKITSSRLVAKLLQYSFYNGFQKRRFSSFTANDLSKILEIFN